MAAHLYWRLLFGGGNGAYVQFGNLEFRASVGGADQTSGGTAIASGAYAGLPASNVFDASASTDWCTPTSGASTGTWVGYQFAAPVDVAQIQVVASNTYPQYAPLVFSVQWSDDGSSWTTAWTPPTQSAWSNGETRTFDAPAAPYRVTAQSLEVLSVSAASARVSAQSIEALVNTYQLRMPKAHAFAVLGPNPAAVALSKAVAYAVLHDTAIGPIPDTPATARRRPVLAFLG